MKTTQSSIASAATLRVCWCALCVWVASPSLAVAGPRVTLEVESRIRLGGEQIAAAEVVVYNRVHQRLLVTDTVSNTVRMLDARDPSRLREQAPIRPAGVGTVNSIATRGGLVAIVSAASDAQSNGSLHVYTIEGVRLAGITVGPMPDMVVFTPDGHHLLVANEGEPSDDYTDDPPGSVSIVSVPESLEGWAGAVVRRVGFEAFDIAGAPEGVRVTGPDALPSRDIEPEYIAVSPDSSTAYVVCQENSAIAVIDIASATLESLVPLGAVDRTADLAGFDPSDRDGGPQIARWPVRSWRQPDTIVAFEHGGETFLATADEGDPRSYQGFEETARVGDLKLDPEAFPDQAVRADDQLGRLKVSRVEGDTDGDGDFDLLYSFGGRAVSIWDARARHVWSSGDSIERVIAARAPERFNRSSGADAEPDGRSDDRGPEPEALAVAQVSGYRLLVCALERPGGLVVFDLTDPRWPRLLEYVPPDASGLDLAPETLAVWSEPGNAGSLVVAAAHEATGVLTVYRLRVHADGGE